MLLLAQVQTGTLVLLAAVGLTVAVLLVRSQRGLRRQPSQAPTASRPQWPAALDTQRPAPVPAQRRTPPEELNRWERDMQELARDMKAELESKMHGLRHLIRSGEALANRLEALVERAERAAATGSLRDTMETPREIPPRSLAHPATQAAALTSAALTAAAQLTGARSTAAQWTGAQSTAALTSGARATVAGTAAPLNASAPSEPLRRFDEIYALADAGCDSATIAGNTGSPVGEVELILSLRER